MIITGTGPYKATSPGFDRGMQTTTYCGNNPESWIRGSATLDTNSGIISMTVQLETDSTTAGPKGRVVATVRDATGKTLATATSDEIGIGGKPPGKAVIRNFDSTVSVPLSTIQTATSLSLEAQCTGSVGQPWGIDLSNVQKAFNIIIALFA